jgi:hypothetical protein
MMKEWIKACTVRRIFQGEKIAPPPPPQLWAIEISSFFFSVVFGERRELIRSTQPNSLFQMVGIGYGPSGHMNYVANCNSGR